MASFFLSVGVSMLLKVEIGDFGDTKSLSLASSTLFLQGVEAFSGDAGDDTEDSGFFVLMLKVA